MASVVDTGSVPETMHDFLGASWGGSSGLRPLRLEDAWFPGLAGETLRRPLASGGILTQGRAPAEAQ